MSSEWTSIVIAGLASIAAAAGFVGAGVAAWTWQRRRVARRLQGLETMSLTESHLPRAVERYGCCRTR